MLHKAFADNFPEHWRALGHEPAVTGLVAGALTGGFVSQNHLAGHHGCLFCKWVDHAEFALGGAEISAADRISRRAEGHFAKGFYFTFEDLRAEVSNSAPCIEFGRLDVFLESGNGHGSSPVNERGGGSTAAVEIARELMKAFSGSQ